MRYHLAIFTQPWLDLILDEPIMQTVFSADN